MMTVAITGRSGCGKSTVTARFVAQGIPVVDADQVARDVLATGSACLPQLQAVFGKDICKGEVLDRKALADRAFATPEGTKLLTEITHPEIISHIFAEKEKACQAGASLFVIDGAVIFGTPCEAECDSFIVISVPYEISVARITARDGISPEMAKRRLDAQMPEEALRAKADYILETNYNLENEAEKAKFYQAIDDLIVHLRRVANVTETQC